MIKILGYNLHVNSHTNICHTWKGKNHCTKTSKNTKYCSSVATKIGNIATVSQWNFRKISINARQNLKILRFCMVKIIHSKNMQCAKYYTIIPSSNWSNNFDLLGLFKSIWETLNSSLPEKKLACRCFRKKRSMSIHHKSKQV